MTVENFLWSCFVLSGFFIDMLNGSFIVCYSSMDSSIYIYYFFPHNPVVGLLHLLMHTYFKHAKFIWTILTISIRSGMTSFCWQRGVLLSPDNKVFSYLPSFLNSLAASLPTNMLGDQKLQSLTSDIIQSTRWHISEKV